MSSRRQLFNISSSKDNPECNIALLGDLGVGKSALTVKYLTKRFIMEYDPHLEDTYQRTETIEGQDVLVRIMDTCEKIGKPQDRYLKWAHGIIVVYSITNRQSFESAQKLLEDLSQYEKDNNKDIAVILVGNKTDLERYSCLQNIAFFLTKALQLHHVGISKQLPSIPTRHPGQELNRPGTVLPTTPKAVQKLDGQKLASQYDCLFHETSAADDFHSVQQLFHLLISYVTRSQEKQVSMQPLFIAEDNKVGTLNLLSSSGRTFRRTKSPGNSSDVIKDNQRGQDKDNRFAQRRMPSTFKILKSRFNIFN